MKQCISRIFQVLIHLWRTLKAYVSKKTKPVETKSTLKEGKEDVDQEKNQ